MTPPQFGGPMHAFHKHQRKEHPGHVDIDLTPEDGEGDAGLRYVPAHVLRDVLGFRRSEASQRRVDGEAEGGDEDGDHGVSQDDVRQLRRRQVRQCEVGLVARSEGVQHEEDGRQQREEGVVQLQERGGRRVGLLLPPGQELHLPLLVTLEGRLGRAQLLFLLLLFFFRLIVGIVVLNSVLFGISIGIGVVWIVRNVVISARVPLVLELLRPEHLLLQFVHFTLSASLLTAASYYMWLAS
mmetsp:Transcript_21432/g.50557  ORF Transcript_21432/g.50557 Transcript_21432/m.50557 type:complete len:240 (+) Transcript_21432:1362-2081(+)